MKCLIPLLGLALFAAPARLAAQDASCAPVVTPSEIVSRGLPHVFFDQAEESLRALYPEHLILASRRVGSIGEVLYALIAYQESAGDSVHLTSLAVSRDGRSAWSVDATCGTGAWLEGLLDTLEAISTLQAAPRE